MIRIRDDTGFLISEINPSLPCRYYDAGTDGYFFEMASVDGWRKRTAAPTNGAPLQSFRGAPGSAPIPLIGAAANQRRPQPLHPSQQHQSALSGYAAYLEQQEREAAAAMAAAHLASRPSYGAALAR